MVLADRCEKTLQILDHQNSIRVSDLSREFNVTEETVRRDLERLEKTGRLKRTHGGAVKIPTDLYTEVSYRIRNTRNMKEKKIIGEFAASMIEPGDVIALDASTTVLQVALAIKKRGLKDITVLTNAINVTLELAEQPGINLMCTGGTLEGTSLSFIGPLAERNLQNYHVKKAFISCKGISEGMGITDADELQAKLKNRMISVAKEVWLLADNGKFNKTAFVPIMPVSVIYKSIDKLVVDGGISMDVVEFYKKKGIEVFVAKK